MSVHLEHKKARLNFELLEKFEAGIELYGHEVKALRGGAGSLEGTHVTIRGGEAYIIGMNIPPYQASNTDPNYDPMRHRRLLLTRKELQTLGGMESQKGLTIVPILVYNKGKHLKITIAFARGKKKFDKRETLKKRDSDRHIERTLKNQ